MDNTVSLRLHVTLSTLVHGIYVDVGGHGFSGEVSGVQNFFLAGELGQHLLSLVNITVFSSSVLARNKEHLYCESHACLRYSTFSVTFPVYVDGGLNTLFCIY